MERNSILVYYDEIKIQVPVGHNEPKMVQAKLCWLEPLSGPFYQAGVEFQDAYPYDTGASIYLVKRDGEEFKALQSLLFE